MCVLDKADQINLLLYKLNWTVLMIINKKSKRKYKRLCSCHFPVEQSLLVKTFPQDWGKLSALSVHVGIVIIPTSTGAWGHASQKDFECPERPSADF